MSRMIDDFDQDANPARIIKVNKRRFVVGLAWRPIDKVSAAAKEARLLAKEEDMNLMLIYSGLATRSEEHTSELQSLMRISYAVFCLTKKKTTKISMQTQTT